MLRRYCRWRRRDCRSRTAGRACPAIRRRCAAPEGRRHHRPEMAPRAGRALWATFVRWEETELEAALLQIRVVRTTSPLVPAKAGTQLLAGISWVQPLRSRLRGNERTLARVRV